MSDRTPRPFTYRRTHPSYNAGCGGGFSTRDEAVYFSQTLANQDSRDVIVYETQHDGHRQVIEIVRPQWLVAEDHNSVPRWVRLMIWLALIGLFLLAVS